MTNDSTPGRVVRPARNGGTKVIRISSNARWSDAAEERFLGTLAETCNVTAAAQAAGFSNTAVYKRRARWPGFAAEWDAAVAQGYARLEARLVELATDSLRERDGGEGDAGNGGRGSRDPIMTIAEATNLLRLHRASARGGAPQNFGWNRATPDPDAMRASILRKIEAMERAGEPVEERRAGHSRSS